MSCSHPHADRWQYPYVWLCCKCYRYFWGRKSETPCVDIYGAVA